MINTTSTMITARMMLDRQNRSNKRMREIEKRNREVSKKVTTTTTNNKEVETSNVKVVINPVTGEKIIITK